MDTLILKLILTPVLIGSISLAGRRWGPTISGWLTGLPLTSGPIAFFLALGQGVTFASAAATGVLIGTISQAVFCVAYSHVAFRFGWPLTLLVSTLVFAASTAVLQPLSVPLIPLFLLVILVLGLTLRLVSQKVRDPAPASRTLPEWDIPARMVVATAYVVLLTSIAPLLGPRLTGLLSPFPLYAAVLTVFAHRLQGPSSAVRVVSGLAFGLFGFASFFLILAGLLPQFGIASSFTVAIVTVLAVQIVALWTLRRLFPMTADHS